VKSGKKSNHLFFYHKNLSNCTKDWQKFRREGMIRYVTHERAAGSRGLLLKGDEMIKVVNQIVEFSKAGYFIGKGKSVEKTSSSAAKKKPEAIAVDFDSLF